jgi:hypothetical protein
MRAHVRASCPNGPPHAPRARGLMHKVPNLYRNRLGTYYLRITVQGREVKRSLGTKDRPKAVRSALLFALARDEALQFDTTALVHRMEPMPQGEPMKNIPSVLRRGRGASDISTQGHDPATDSSTLGVPDIGLPAAAKKLDVLVDPSGVVRLPFRFLGKARSAKAALGRPGCTAGPGFEVTERDPPFGEVVRRQLERHRVTGKDADEVLAHLAGSVGDEAVAIVQRDSKARVGQHFGNLAIHFDQFFLGQYDS